jgi:hypothetical protein
MIVCINPGEPFASESNCSLSFATNVNSTALGKARKNVVQSAAITGDTDAGGRLSSSSTDTTTTVTGSVAAAAAVDDGGDSQGSAVLAFEDLEALQVRARHKLARTPVAPVSRAASVAPSQSQSQSSLWQSQAPTSPSQSSLWQSQSQSSVVDEPAAAPAPVRTSMAAVPARAGAGGATVTTRVSGVVATAAPASPPAARPRPRAGGLYRTPIPKREPLLLVHDGENEPPNTPSGRKARRSSSAGPARVAGSEPVVTQAAPGSAKKPAGPPVEFAAWMSSGPLQRTPVSSRKLQL